MFTQLLEVMLPTHVGLQFLVNSHHCVFRSAEFDLTDNWLRVVSCMRASSLSRQVLHTLYTGCALYVMGASVVERL